MKNKSLNSFDIFRTVRGKTASIECYELGDGNYMMRMVADHVATVEGIVAYDDIMPRADMLLKAWTAHIINNRYGLAA